MDIGVGYIGIQVPNLDMVLPQVLAAGATLVSKPGILTMRGGTLELFDEPRAKEGDETRESV